MNVWMPARGTKPAIQSALEASNGWWVKQMTKRLESPRLGLTSSEQRVFARLLLGESNKEVARNLGCSVKNVEYHVSNILRRAQAPTMKKLLADLVGAL